MKIPYILKYDDGEGGRQFGPFIRINGRYRNDVGLLAHEIEHVKQWWAVSLAGLALFIWAGGWLVFAWLPFVAYHLLCQVSPIQRWIELRCWRVQLSKYGECRAKQAAKIFSTKYDFKMTEDEAYRLLKRKEVVL